jgi:sugar/nucleoside kinase (ribokinase family)
VMIDIVMKISSIPASGSDVLAREHLVTTGGGYNAMSAAARQDMSVVYAGRLGTGPYSEIARTSLERDHIVTPVEPHGDLDNGFCVVLLDDGGERTFITSRGAEGTLRESDLAALDVCPCDYVLVSGYNVMDQGSGEVVVPWLSQLPSSVVLAFDPSNRVLEIPTEFLEPVLARCDWLLCNESEAAKLTGMGSPAQSSIDLGARCGRRGVVVRHGATGCTVALAGEPPVQIEGFVTTVIDTNGAGDVHNGVFLAECAMGGDVIDAARRANAAAAMAIAVLGPASGPPKDVITQWMHHQG